MENIRHIVTKAIVAKGKTRSEGNETLHPPNSPSSILGCWIINHTHQAKKIGKHVEVSGKFDVNVWYSHSEHSKTSVFTETIAYKDHIDLNYRDEPTSRHEEVIVNVVQHPNCTEAIISKCGGKFIISVERELIAEVVGETKVCITVHPHDYEEEWAFKDDSPSNNEHPHSSGPNRAEQPSHERSHGQNKGRDSSPL